MSFREYLNLERRMSLPSYRFSELVKNHVDIADGISRQFKVLPAFERYLKMGYYPFYREEPEHFTQKLLQVVNQVLDSPTRRPSIIS